MSSNDLLDHPEARAAGSCAAQNRFVAAGYMTGDVACWDAAYDGAERVLGEVEGPAGFLLVAPVSIKPLPRNSVWLLG